jgi:deoxyribose-phosphate aldolase
VKEKTRIRKVGRAALIPWKCRESLASQGGSEQNAEGEEIDEPIDEPGTPLALQTAVVPTEGSLSNLIDHTILKPEATQDEIAQICHEAREHGFASVCVNPTHAMLCADLLKGSEVQVCTVVGFPLGATSPEAKAFETRQAIRDGATEVDMVINVGALRSHDYELVERDMAGVAQVCQAGGAILKVIIEAALLTDEEKVTACKLAIKAQAEFVKTSTGFGPGGATPEDVTLMRQVVGSQMGVKAAGGIKTKADAEKMIEAGASRIGASASVRIVQEASS